MERDYPALSLRERDRRWKNIRGLMKAKGLDCLIVAGLKGREQLEGYLSNDYAQGIVLFPLVGEPAYLARNTRILRNMENCLRGVPSWIDDWRGGGLASGLVDVIREKGLESAAIGVVGLESEAAGESEGYVPYRMWSFVLKQLPKATFIEVSKPFAELMLVKSEEEIALVKQSAWIGEKACEAMVKATKPGASEGEICAAIMSTILTNGASSPNMILHSGVDNLCWGEPIWFYKAQRPRTVQRGRWSRPRFFHVTGGLRPSNRWRLL